MPRESAIVESAIMERVIMERVIMNASWPWRQTEASGTSLCSPLGHFFDRPGKSCQPLQPGGPNCHDLLLSARDCATQMALAVQEIYFSACSATGTV
jgi:hypothetical protein